MTDPRYPIGRFERPDRPASPKQRAAWIADIEALPRLLRAAVDRLGEADLDAPYRPGGWTRRQVVHHVADSHLNAVVRMRLALTEDAPVIKPYDEARWAELADARTLAPEPSLALLDGLHARWTALLRSLEPDDFARAFVHPEHGRAVALDEALAHYAWHGRHHTAHLSAP